MSVRDSMSKQYGDKTPKIDIPGWLIFLMKHFGISREEFVAKLLTPGEAFLDIGSGNGALCLLAQNKFKKLFGIDVSSERIARMLREKQIPSHIQFLNHDLNNRLPFQNEEFDCITSLHTLEWVYDLNVCLHEIYRVLKPNGTFIVQVANLAFLPKRLKLLIGKYPNTSSFARSSWKDIGWDSNVTHMFTRESFEPYLREFGFSIRHVSGTGILYPLRQFWPSLLCGDLIFVCSKDSKHT